LGASGPGGGVKDRPEADRVAAQHPGSPRPRRPGSGSWSRGPRAASGQRNPQAGRQFLRGGARPPVPQVVAFIDANRDDVVDLRSAVEVSV